MKTTLFFFIFLFLNSSFNAQCVQTLSVSGTDGCSCNITGGACTAAQTHSLSSIIPSGQPSVITFSIINAGVFYSCMNPITIFIRVYAMPANQLIYSYSCNTAAFNHFLNSNCPSELGLKTVSFTPTSNVTSIRFEGTSNFVFGCGTQPFSFQYNFASNTGGVGITTTGTPPTPSASSPGPITCSSPNVTLSGSGGASYSWSGPGIVSGATTANPVVNAGGTYNLTVTGSNGCTANTSVNVSTDTTPPSPSASSPGPITCSSPNVTLSGSGGGSYSWSGPSIVSGATTANPVVNAGGTYNLTITGSNGCTAGTSVNVTTDNAPPSPSASSPGPITCSSPNVTLSGSGGGSYSWSGPSIVSGATTANPVVNAGGTYNLTVTGSNGCTANTSVNVTTDTAPPSPSASSPGPITCSSPNVTLSGSGGGSYSWSGPGIVSGATTANPVVNAGGTYNLTVTGSNGCTANTSVNVTTNTTPPSPGASSPGPITCSSPNVTLSGSGGGSYSWSGPSIVSGATTANPVVNAGGTYNLTVTGSNGCTANTSVNVSTDTTPPSPGASAPGPITCSSPNVTLSGSGGGSYNWSGPGIVSGATTANPVVNAGGTYNLTVTGANGCTANTSVNVTQSTSLPTASSSPSTTNLNCTTTSASLNGGASGGTAPYVYSWSPATGLSATNIANPTANPSSSTTYVLTVTDDNGCQSTSNVTINVNTTPPSVSATGGVLDCTNTSINLSSSGGGSYSWSGPGIVSGGTTANPTVNQPGTYNLTVTGTNGCTANTSASVSQNTTTPSAAITGANTLSTTCANPTATLTASSTSDPSTTYQWLTPSSTTLTGNPVTANTAGVYTVIVTNTGNGCKSSALASANNTVQIVPDSNIPNVTLSSNAGTITCSTLNVSVTASVNVSTVTYNWLPTSGIQSGANTANPTFTAGGSYSLTVTNTANSCVSGGSGNVVNVTQNNTNPTAGASSGVTVLDCNNSSITLTGTGGGNYNWSGPGIVSGATTANPVVNQTGTYSLVVTDPNNDCNSTNSAVVTITQNTTVPSITSSSTGTINTTCANPTATLTATSSSDPNTTYNWLTPSSTTLTGNPVTTSVAGIYTLVIIDNNNGCSSSALASSNNTVEIVPDSNIPTATLSANNVQITCSDPTPSVVANTSNTNLTYNWTPSAGILSGANTNNPTFDAPGSYSLVMTNTVNSCVSNPSDYVVTVTTNTNAPVISLSGTSNTGTITCANPSVIVTPSINPSAGLTYTWSPSPASGPNQVNATFTSPGVYQLAVTNTLTGCVSVMDANSSFTVSINTNSPTVNTVPVSSNSVVGCGTNATVTYSANITSSNTNVSYSWLPSSSITSTANISSSATQTLLVTDNDNGCVTMTTFTVESNTSTPNLTSAALALMPCDSPTTSLMASSTNSNVSYSWQGTGITVGGNTNNPTVNSLGMYTVTVTDLTTMCTNTQVVTLIQDSVVALFNANPTTGTAPLTVDFTNQTISTNSLGTTYSWFFGDGNSSTQTNPNNVFNTHGTFTIELIATLGVCNDTAYMIMMIEEDLLIKIPNFFTPNGDNNNELFFIDGIEKYPNNKLEIYNRWGSLVYKKDGYDNTFDGKPNQPSMGNGLLPSATYFYTLDLGEHINGTETKTKIFKGYVELKY